MKRTLLQAVAVVTACVSLAACDRVASNVHVLSTADCGATWVKLDTGNKVPTHTGNRCGYNLPVPNWPMAGETVFKTTFSKGVLTTIRLSYTYSITGPLAFIGEARYLGKMGGSLELSAENIGDRYEMAENIIIDKTLREVTTELTRDLDIVTANPAEIEEAIHKSAMEVLQKKGITMADIAMVVENDEQTKLAIDSATAIRIYDAADIGAVGRQIMAARAGATKIEIHSQPKQ